MATLAPLVILVRLVLKPDDVTAKAADDAAIRCGVGVAQGHLARHATEEGVVDALALVGVDREALHRYGRVRR